MFVCVFLLATRAAKTFSSSRFVVIVDVVGYFKALRGARMCCAVFFNLVRALVDTSRVLRRVYRTRDCWGDHNEFHINGRPAPDLIFFV